jgi:hypothetical protein
VESKQANYAKKYGISYEIEVEIAHRKSVDPAELHICAQFAIGLALKCIRTSEMCNIAWVLSVEGVRM